MTDRTLYRYEAYNKLTKATRWIVANSSETARGFLGVNETLTGARYAHVADNKLRVGSRVSCFTSKQVEGTVTAILTYGALTVRVDGEDIDRGFNRSTVALLQTKGDK